jgi:hypothetical protein
MTVIVRWRERVDAREEKCARREVVQGSVGQQRGGSVYFVA